MAFIMRYARERPCVEFRAQRVGVEYGLDYRIATASICRAMDILVQEKLLTKTGHGLYTYYPDGAPWPWD